MAPAQLAPTQMAPTQMTPAWTALAQLTLVQLAPAQTRDWQGCEVPLTLCQGFGKGEGKGLCFSTPPNPSLHMFTLHTLHTPEIY